jgi:hypothetical protein
LAAHSQCVHEVGIALGHGSSPQILRGPYYGRSYTFGGRRWERPADSDEWELLEDR